MRDQCDSNIDLKTQELIRRIKNEQPAPTEEPIPSPLTFFEPIKQKYLRDDRIKRMMNEEKSFPIEQSYINLALVETKEQQEIEKKLKYEHNQILGTFEEIYGAKTSVDVEDIFGKCKDQIKKVLMLGRAGIGKSTFCQYVTYRWAKGEIWSQI
ncbi:unnamed protein product [Rotaria magnacalcarata]|uniref:Uncharacterized protein n=1 Tax=Rotaria magnacalcarata TaxID=392030 RepID=A0A8S3EE02_9BILA|nr:unnamed protein product [Rotaria magnacalcarata]